MARYEPIGDGTVGPVTKLKIHKPGGGPADFENIRGVLDTGSPITYVPLAVLESLELPVRGRRTVTGLDATPKSALVTQVDITMLDPEFAHVEFPAVDVCVWCAPFALIGRNMLERFVLTFDGPTQEWRVASGPSEALGARNDVNTT